jgi:ATP-dependent DNA helicase RecQ
LSLPPNYETARQLLHVHGPLPVPELAARLRDTGRFIDEDKLLQLPELHPEYFTSLPDGRLTLPDLGVVDPEGDSTDDPPPGWWHTQLAPDPWPRDGVLVIDIETTGLSLEGDRLTQVGWVNLGNRESECFTVGDGEESTATALERIADALGSAVAVAGHNIGYFDLPFLAEKARQLGVPFEVELPVLDLHTLSVLVDPGLTDRTLGGLARNYEVEQLSPHDALDDARVTADLIDLLLNQIEPDDPNWAIAARLLAKGELPWCHLVPFGESPPGLIEALRPRSDPLIEPESDIGGEERPERAQAAVQVGFRELERLEADLVRPFRRRDGQLEMAREVAASLDGGTNLAVEAPTGTGKTLAYLLPATAATPQRPVVIATATKVLQRQLRDEAKRLQDHGLLKVPFRQIQGVNNYLCTREIADSIEAGDAEENSTEWLALAVAVRGLATAQNGLWDDIGDVHIARSDISYRNQRARLRATTHTCERRDCDWYRQCPLFNRLSGAGKDAGILVANHALVAAWSRLANEGVRAPGDVFGDRPATFIFDEAHDLEDSLTGAWTESVGSFELAVTLGKLRGRRGPIRQAERVAREANVAQEPLEKLRGLLNVSGDLLGRLSQTVEEYLRQYAGNEGAHELRPGIDTQRSEYLSLTGAAFDVSARLMGQIQFELINVVESLEGCGTDDPELGRRASRSIFRLRAAVEDLNQPRSLLENLRELPESHRFVHLLVPIGGDESDEFHWRYDSVPIDVSRIFRDEIAGRSRATVLTSATLTVADSFDFLARQLGLHIEDLDGESNPDAPPPERPFRTIRVPSPFDYSAQSSVILTNHLPLSGEAYQQQYCREVGADQVGFLSLSGGKTLVLFAARTRMHETAQLVTAYSADLESRGVRLLVQEREGPDQIANLFRSDPGTALFGLRRYWTGFDAPGDTLSYLIIEKPPYPHMGDAVVAARKRAIIDAGGDPFLDYIVPKTAIALAQGFGRLIRSEDDRGAAVILDRRMQQPSEHQRVLLETLPTNTIVYTNRREEWWSEAIRFVTGEEPDIEAAIQVAPSEVDEILQQLRLLPGEDPTAKLEQAALKVFGIDQIHRGQLELMRAVLEGRDALGFMPTGSGKSLCFQLPALLHPQGHPTVVVAPLVALIKDQVDELRSRLGLREVTGITGQTSGSERTEILNDLVNGRIRLLYVSPERLVRDLTLRGALERLPLGCLVIDEAHCVSSWGHDFRPEFRQIAKAVLDFRRSPRLGLTATATPEVEEDITTTLGMDDPRVVRQPVDRPDLYWHVTEVRTNQERASELFRFVHSQGTAPGIVYATKRATTEEIAWLLRQAGYEARSYHAGMVPEQRSAIQEDFLAGTTQIIVATKAFGMGVNKPDIGWVVHYDPPGSLEEYSQEAGRAARRSGLVGNCLLLWSRRNFTTRRGWLSRPAPYEDPATAQAALNHLAGTQQRNDDHVIDEESFADELNIDPDHLNVLIAWLERTGHLVRKPDCAARGAVTFGVQEPDDPDELRDFINLNTHLGARLQTRRLINIGELAAELNQDPDDLEDKFNDWSLRRLVTFHSTQRFWRISLSTTTLDVNAFTEVATQWRNLQRARLNHMENYATGHRCRRATISEIFGDPGEDCGDRPGALPCDVCSTDLPAWMGLESFGAPDPEQLVDIQTVALTAVLWTCQYQGGRYGKASLMMALLGEESFGSGRRISSGLLSCPQFGALKALSNRETRLDKAIEELKEKMAIREETITRPDETTYPSLVITQIGRAMLGGRGA